MINQYVIMQSDQYSIELLVDEIDFDYYTDIILRLCFDKKVFILLKDNVLYLKNTISQYIENIDSFDLDKRLNDKELGILYNEYYYCIYQGITSQKILLNSKSLWIGEKYCCFSTSEYVTWLYKRNDNIYLKVTPVFQGLGEKDANRRYQEFQKEYSDICSIVLPIEALERMLKILLELCDRI